MSAFASLLQRKKSGSNNNKGDEPVVRVVVKTPRNKKNSRERMGQEEVKVEQNNYVPGPPVENALEEKMNLVLPSEIRAPPTPEPIPPEPVYQPEPEPELAPAVPELAPAVPEVKEAEVKEAEVKEAE